MAHAGLYEPETVYEEIADLVARATDAGAQTVEARGVQWHDTPTGPRFQATALIRTTEGREIRRDGYAAPGDAQAPDAPPADGDLWVEARAEKRALAAAIRTAFPQVEPEGQSPPMRRLQALLRQLAEALRLDRDQLARHYAVEYDVVSTGDLTDQQCDQLCEVIESRLAIARRER